MRSGDAPGLTCLGLQKAFGSRTVLAGVDLEVPAGTLTAILGASGAGKTTLLRAVMGLEHVDAGRIMVGGEAVADDRLHVPTQRRRVGYVSQEGALFPQLTVARNIGFGLPRGERKASRRIDEVLGLVGLGPQFGSRQPNQLSGGEQRRVALARALAPRPRVILLDEPFSGLDAALRAETREAVLAALAEEEATALLVTHDQAEALSMGHQVGVLRDGRLVQLAEPEVLYRQPIDVAVARFVGEAVVLPGTVRASRAWCALGTIPSDGPAHEGPVDVVLRPEQVKLLPRDDSSCRPTQDPPDGPCLQAKVTRRRFFGSEVTVTLLLGDGHGDESCEIMARMAEHAAPSVGQVVDLEVVGSARAYPRPGGSPLEHPPRAV
jgi:iron(III) transport system ATP-binding protein